MRTNRYLEDTVRTAPPQTLLLMLWDRLVLDLRTAADHLRAGEKQPARARIEHAQSIVLELRGTLKLDDWPEGEGLAALYSWWYRELNEAWLHHRERTVVEVLDQMLPLRDAWREAAAALTPERPLLTSNVV